MKFTLKDTRRATHTPTASFNIILNPIIDITTWLIVNFTNFSPNFITSISFILVILSAYFFIIELYWLGSIFFLLRYILDHVDGRVARLRKKTSKFGTYFDNVSGYIGSALCTIAIIYPLNKTIIAFLIPMLIMMSLIHPLQATIAMLYLKNIRKRIYKETFGFEDFRLITFVIVPLLPYFIKIKIALLPVLALTIFFFIIKQIAWMIYYYKDFKEQI